ncbi:hypothetical protein K2X40_03310 [Candidatus Babeliales bacterium]|nr:hypothetical protein [Candidatus Babeliales bacterium]
MPKDATIAGFVIKKFLPSQPKISLLTAPLGKISIFVKNKASCEKLWPGMLVSLTAQVRGEHAYTTDTVTILALPSIASNDDITWVHHLLELCYYIIPLQSPAENNFMHLAQYLSVLDYKELFENDLSLLKMLCILHLLHTTGNTDEKILRNAQLLEIISTLPTLLAHESKQALKQNLALFDSNDLGNITNSIKNYLRTHPCFNLFKTIKFMYLS